MAFKKDGEVKVFKEKKTLDKTGAEKELERVSVEDLEEEKQKEEKETE